MKEFEDQLRRALRPVDPPAGFVERTLARAGEPLRKRPPRRVLQFPRYAMALAASLALVVFGMQYREYRQGQEAKEQLMTALHITGSQLSQIQAKVLPMGQEK
jgi:hypothetical protein